MPIIWRYIAQGYLRVFFLSVCTFIAVLLVSRFKEIARFTALSGDFFKTSLFAAYQIPLILPIAIPLSSLIASLLLFQRLSRTFELTALRASGVGLRTILAPILLLSSLLSLSTFSFCAEIAPSCRRESRNLLYRATSTNPLLLLQRQNLVKLKQSYMSMQVEEEGKSAKNFILVTYNPSHERLSLITARKLRMTNDELLGRDVAIISHLCSEKEDAFDSLLIENQSSMATDPSALSSFLKKGRPRLEANTLGLQMLQLRQNEGGKQSKKAFVEILRRTTLSLAAFTFTLLGCAFGIEQGRNPSKKNVLIALSLALLVMMSYLLGKELKSSPLLATLIFLLPHPITWLSCARKLQSISKGT